MTAIIITGRKRGGPRQAAHYLTAKGDNDFVRLRQIRSFVAKTVHEALAEMWAVADGCKAKDFLYHATLNPRPGVTLTPAQWREAIDRLEQNLGLTGHQRVVVEHEKKGRIHYHVIWNRVNPKTGRVKKLSFDRRTLRATALELEALFKLEPTANKGQSLKRGEIERGKRTGIDPRQVKAEITALWNRSTSGQHFAASLAKHGYILARGDRGQFVIIDRASSAHGLTRRIDGATAQTVRQKLADIDPASLPTVAEAKRQARAARSKTSFRACGREQMARRSSFAFGSLGSRQPAAAATAIKPTAQAPMGAPSTVTAALIAATAAAKTKRPAPAPSSATPTEARAQETNEPASAGAPADNPELDGILAAITDDVQRNAATARSSIMASYAGQIDHARKTLPHHQLAAAIRAILDARAAELATISRNAASEAAGRRKAAIEQRRFRTVNNKVKPSHKGNYGL